MHLVCTCTPRRMGQLCAPRLCWKPALGPTPTRTNRSADVDAPSAAAVSSSATVCAVLHLGYVGGAVVIADGRWRLCRVGFALCRAAGRQRQRVAQQRRVRVGGRARRRRPRAPSRGWPGQALGTGPGRRWRAACTACARCSRQRRDARGRRTRSDGLGSWGAVVAVVSSRSAHQPEYF